MRRAPLILVFGVSGVGKTTFCRYFADQKPDLKQISASQVIRDVKAVSRTSLLNAAKSSILENQKALIEGLKRLNISKPRQPLIVDAHAMISSSSGSFTVPTSVIAKLDPSILVLLEASPEVIADRRALRSDLSSNSRATILEEIAAERNAVLRYSKELNLPLAILDFSPHRSLNQTASILDKFLGQVPVQI